MPGSGVDNSIGIGGFDKRSLLIVTVSVYIVLVLFINSYDYEVFKNWFSLYNDYGLTSIYHEWPVYGSEYRVVYPPLSPATFIVSYKIAHTLSLEGLLGVVLERITVKLPMIAVIIVYAYFIKRLYGDSAGWLILLGPPVLLVVAAYDFEPFMMLSILLSLYLLSKGNPYGAGLFAAIATLYKPVAFVIFIYTALVIVRRSIRLLLRYTSVYVAILGLVLAPFIHASGLNSIVDSIVFYHTNRPFQGPSLFSILQLSEVLDLKSPLSIPSLVMLLLIVAASLLLAIRSHGVEDLDYHMAASGLLLSLIPLFGSIVNPVYFYWSYVLIIPIALKYGEGVRIYAITGLLLIVVGLWYSIPMTISMVLDKPYYDEELQRYIKPEQVDEIINESIGIISPVDEDPITRSQSIVRLLASMAMHKALLRLILSTAYMGLSVILIYKLITITTRIAGPHRTVS